MRSEVKACEACKSSKRKCTKQLPRCRRCELRGLSCLYESRPRMIVYQADEGGTLSRTRGISNHDDEPLEPPLLATIDPQLELHLAPACPSLDDLRTAWFLTPDAWRNTPIEPFNFSPISTAMIQGHLDKTKDWLKEWVRTGSNPFIHAALYTKGMPDCVHDAFMAMSTYLSRTDKTADMIHRLIEEKADKLVASPVTREHGRYTLQDIGRVQSLVVYCVIRLLDGDVRQRHFAEKHLPVLQDWARDMLSHAAHATNDDTFLFSNSLTNYTSTFTTEPPIPCAASPEHLLWNAWILSESIRRTWCVAMALQSSYDLLKTGMTNCPGGLLVTTRKGVWDAESAYAWTKVCAEGSVWFMHRNETERLMAEARTEEVDAFAMAMMEVDAGPERMARWQHGNRL